MVFLASCVSLTVQYNYFQGTYEYLEHCYTDDQPEIHEALAAWREHIDEYSHGTGRKM